MSDCLEPLNNPWRVLAVGLIVAAVLIVGSWLL